MGRGRAKAKQTKVARELKYSSGPLDIGALSAELSHDRQSSTGVDQATPVADEGEDDEYATYADGDDAR